MAYSVQQIKFELLGFIKEFGADPKEWCVGTCDDTQRSLFSANTVDEADDIWVWKPALSPAAARMIQTFLIERIGVRPASSEPGSKVFIFRKRSLQA